MDGGEDAVVELDGDGGTDFGMGGGAEDAQLGDLSVGVGGADFVLAVVEEKEGLPLRGFGQAPVETVVGKGEVGGRGCEGGESI